jgi:predicted transcriptional regulator
MNVLLSIRPEYSRKIFSGEKRYEFRKRRPQRSVGKVFVYECRPSRSIVGWFSVRRIHSGSPEEIWERCKESGGIRKESYFAYCSGRKIIHAFEIDEIFRFDCPLDPFDCIRDFRAPQDFVYFYANRVQGALGDKKYIDSTLLECENPRHETPDLAPCAPPPGTTM